MMSSKRKFGLYYGWYIVGVCFLIMGISEGVGTTFAVFFKPLIDEFHWSRTALSGAAAVSLVVGGLTTPLWGNWTDRSGTRVVVVTAALFSGLSLLLSSRITTLWHLYALSIFGAIFFSGISLVPLSTAVSHWFSKKRGLAMGVTLVGGGVGGLIMAPLTNYLIESKGWRASYLLIGIIMWVVVIPIAALILRRRPQDFGLLPDGKAAPSNQVLETGRDDPALEGAIEETQPDGLMLRQAMGKNSFWMLALAFFLPMMSGTAFFTHFVAMFTDMGVSSQTAATCLGLLGGLSIAGRLGYAHAADRFGARRVFTACFIIETLGVSMLLGVPLVGTGAVYAFVIIYGLTTGGGYALAPLIVADCFGLKEMGTIFSTLSISAMVGAAVGPILSGFIFDNTGSYYLSFVIFTVGEATAAFAVSRARSPLSLK